LRIWYLPLEPYVERYTWQLQKWTETAFHDHGLSFTTVLGQGTPQEITTGRVLDAHGRCLWALSQMAHMVKHLQTGAVQPDDVILLHDLFHPGYEALPYILAQQFGDEKPRIYAQNWAQSVDVYDFTFPMRKWMRPYEQMCDKTLDGVFVASEEHKNLLLATGLDTADIHVIGLPFCGYDVRKEINLQPWSKRKRRVVFTSRWDSEKQPTLFLKLAEAAKQQAALQDVEFAVCTGAKELRSNSPSLVQMARYAQKKGVITLYEGLSKSEYYNIVADSQVHFHCSLQDWVSFTMLEASALGTPTLAPAFRSFPEALFSDGNRLYVPWSISDALGKLGWMLNDPSIAEGCRDVAQHHDRTLSRMCRILRDGD
jgi:glycosyltransferase involved in cell wall biosynthesis